MRPMAAEISTAGVGPWTEEAIASSLGALEEFVLRDRVETIHRAGVVFAANGMGADDPLVPKAGGEDTVANIPGAELHLVPGMGHNLPKALITPICDLIELATARARAPASA